MRGLPQCNFPTFNIVTDCLRRRGLDIISPAELESDAARADAEACVSGEHLDEFGGQTIGSILARDVGIIADKCDAIIFLHGWERSKGARLEAFTGLLFEKDFYAYLGYGTIHQLTADEVRYQLIRNIP
jgi:hypothetical protein